MFDLYHQSSSQSLLKNGYFAQVYLIKKASTEMGEKSETFLHFDPFVFNIKKEKIPSFSHLLICVCVIRKIV